jgi:hypothetical protein
MKPLLFQWNYWYAARANEIFLDLDSNRAIARALSVLRLAVIQKRLPVRQVWLYSTLTTHHAHMIIVLRGNMSHESRLAWSLWLGNDRLRTAYVLYRLRLGVPGADLLVSRMRYFRMQDALCLCTDKHKEPSVTDKCPAMEMFLCGYRSADFFARVGHPPPKRKIRVPWGRVSLKQLREWKEIYERK